ncbi:hypothetical protein GGS21DRAFT_74382 [Xylaria nigripes]|nr:hypothetical protein GGS21DRAFT_74382 [Xylaria nigripes]
MGKDHVIYNVLGTNNACPVLELHEWNRSKGWQHRNIDIHKFISNQSDGNDLVSAETEVCIAFTNANEVRGCAHCKPFFINKLSMPKQWWTDASRKSNGYFGCHVAAQYIGTWSYFEMKQLGEGDKYNWYKLNVYMRWDRTARQTMVLCFDTPKFVQASFLHQLQNPNPETLSSPFWFYPYLVGEVVQIQESAVWAVRDKIRAVETEAPHKGRPQPNYRYLHNLARHSIHVTETLDVAVGTMERMLSRHESLLRVVSARHDEAQSHEVHSQLQFYESFISSLRHRSIANDKRLLNEIQLAFNIVAQHDASTSLKVAVVALIFLPPTFVSAIFSMSFFDFSADAGWIVSDKFWLYWAFAVPITIVTAILWFLVRRFGVPVLTIPKDGGRRALTFSV